MPGDHARRLKVVVLQPSYEGSDSVIKDLDVPRDLSQWLSKDFDIEHVFLKKTSIVPQIRKANGDIYVNLCDGAWDEDTPGIDVVLALERLKLPFTGAPSRFYDPSKEEMKKVCYFWNIKTPKFQFVYNKADIARAAETIPFPLFVKHFHGYNSVGITEKSKVTTIEGLYEQAEYFIDRFGGALVEEFVSGREYSVLVCSNPEDDQEPLTFAPVECMFQPGVNFKTFNYKWQGTKNPWFKVEDKVLAEKLQKICKDMFVAMRGEGYARADIRIDEAGDVFLLEINPNPSIFYPDSDNGTADMILIFDGYGKANFLNTSIEFALKRRSKLEKKYTVALDKNNELRTYARSDLCPGEVIVENEEKHHRLASRSHLESRYPPVLLETHLKHSRPLSSNVCTILDDYPENWTAISSSLSPNARLEGLNVVAITAIAAGDEITLNYDAMPR